jgi:hypothetical protein
VATRILLRSRKDGLFVSGALTWSPRLAQAELFPNALAAQQFARTHGLKQMEIIIMREKMTDLRIPLD